MATARLLSRGRTQTQVDLRYPIRKPAGAVGIDWSNPISRGLVLYVDYGKTGFADKASPSNPTEAAIIHDLIGCRLLVSFGNVGAIADKEGYLFSSTASADSNGGVETKTTWVDVFGDHEATYLVRLRRNNVASNLLSNFDATTSTHYPFSGTFYNGIFRANRLTLSGVYDSSVDDNLHNVCITSSDARNEYVTYIKGKAKHTTTPNWGIPSTGSNEKLLGGGYLYKDIAFFAMWNRALTADEVASLE